jgi:hypothetical protein
MNATSSAHATQPTPLTPEIAKRVADAWVRDWNALNLEAILAHYAEDVTFTSPLAVRLMNRPDGTLHGKAELRTYFTAGLAANPKLRFALDDVMVGVDSVALVYRNHRAQRVVEVMHLDSRGQVYRAVVQYTS